MITGNAKIAGVMGWPVAHSLSPKLHGHWLEVYGIDGAYIPMAVAPDKIEVALRSLPVLGFRGCNLTVPHKEHALGIVDDLDPVAKRIGAVNTIVVEGDKLIGTNTDYLGFMAALKADAPDCKTGVAIVLGAGGAARAVVAGLVEMGFSQIRIVNRTAEKADRLIADLQVPDVVFQRIAWDDLQAALADADFLVNTTTLGMKGQPPLIVDLSALPETCVVMDIVYTPLMTALLLAAQARGLPVVTGIGMLLHQAAPGFEAWFGQKPEVTSALEKYMLDS